VLERRELRDWQSEQPVLCIGARTALDEAVAIMLAQLCSAHGLAARVEGPKALATANIFRLDSAGTALVCLSYVGNDSPAHMRFAVRRLRRKLPQARIMVGAWGQNEERAIQMAEACKSDLFGTSLRQAIQMSVMEAKARDAVGLVETVAAQG
jgi:hypothetical protein